MAKINSKSRSDRSWEEPFQYQKMQQGAFVEIYAPPWKYSRLKSRLNICSQGLYPRAWHALDSLKSVTSCEKLVNHEHVSVMCFQNPKNLHFEFRWNKTYMIYHRPVGSKIIRCSYQWLLLTSWNWGTFVYSKGARRWGAFVWARRLLNK